MHLIDTEPGPTPVDVEPFIFKVGEPFVFHFFGKQPLLQTAIFFFGKRSVHVKSNFGLWHRLYLPGIACCWLVVHGCCSLLIQCLLSCCRSAGLYWGFVPERLVEPLVVRKGETGSQAPGLLK